jgi:hypothetical protein
MEHLPPGGELQLEYGDVPLAPVMFIDDILNIAECLNQQARKVNEKIDIIMKQRGLSLNRDKSVFLIICSKKDSQKATSELANNPLMCGEFETKMKSEYKWLGQILSSNGLAASVSSTVLSREGKIRGACLEIAVVVNDWRCNTVGGMETALMLWETCCISSLLHGAGTWTEIDKQTEKHMNQLQNWYLRLILRVGPGAASASLRWDFQVLDMSLRVWREKAMMVLHIRSLDKDTLAYRVYREQYEKEWPGLARETKLICEELGIEDCNTTCISKSKYKILLTEACHEKNKQLLISTATDVKCSRIQKEEYGAAVYFKNTTIEDTRRWFKSRFGLQAFAGNFSHNKRFAKTDWLCRCKVSVEDEGHIVSGLCPVYGGLRTQFGDLGEDRNLVEFFTAVLDRRDELEEEDRRQQS